MSRKLVPTWGLMSESRSAANSSSCCLSSCSAKVRPAAPTEQTAQRRVGLFNRAHTETHREASGRTQTHKIRVQTWTDPCRHRRTRENTHVMHARQAVQHSNTCCGPQQGGGEVLTQQLQAVWGGAVTMTRSPTPVTAPAHRPHPHLAKYMNMQGRWLLKWCFHCSFYDITDILLQYFVTITFFLGFCYNNIWAFHWGISLFFQWLYFLFNPFKIKITICITS